MCAHLAIHLELILSEGFEFRRGHSTMEEEFGLHKQEEIIEQEPNKVLASADLHRMEK